MRPAIQAVMVLSVLAVGLFGSTSEAGRSKRPARPVVENPTWEVEGVAKTRAGAEGNALEKARDRVMDYLTERYGEGDWKLTPAYLSQLQVTHPAGDPEQINLPLSGESWRVRLTVELTPDALSEIQKLAREHRMTDRHRLALRWLMGLVSLLGVVFGYLRLEEATRGYHTTLLRLAALAVLVGAGLFLWKLG